MKNKTVRYEVDKASMIKSCIFLAIQLALFIVAGATKNEGIGLRLEGAFSATWMWLLSGVLKTSWEPPIKKIKKELSDE